MPDIQILIDEITNDPLVRGYSGMTDEQVAVDMNAKNRARDRANVPVGELLDVIDTVEFQAMSSTAGGRQNLDRLLVFAELARDGFDATKATVKTKLRGDNGIFSDTSDTATKLNAMFQETVSRGVEIQFGHVRTGDVGRARA